MDMPPHSLIAQARGAIGAGSRQDDSNGPFVLITGQGLEEKVDGHLGAASLHRFGQAQISLGKGHVLVGRCDIDVIFLKQGAPFDLRNRHRRAAAKKAGHQAFTVRVQVLDNNESHAIVGGQGLEKCFQRLDAAGGGADADHY